MLKEFYVCPRGRAISGEKQVFFACPKCGKPLCPERKLALFQDKYCGNCGTEIASAVKKALATPN